MALNLSSDDNSDLSALGVRVSEAGAAPTRPQVQSYLGSLAEAYGYRRNDESRLYLRSDYGNPQK